jgi:hypothetical protein
MTIELPDRGVRDYLTALILPLSMSWPPRLTRRASFRRPPAAARPARRRRLVG